MSLQCLFEFLIQIVKEPKVLLLRLKMVFQMVCFLLAIYMAVSFVKRFNENDNVTSITYKPFNDGPADKYPTYSICFKGSRFHWYRRENIFEAFELSFEQFEMMLKGEPAFRYDFDLSLRLFRKVPTFVNNGSDVTFNNFHLRASDFLKSADLTTHNSYHSRGFTMHGEKAISEFSITYQTPDMICFTRDSRHVAGLRRYKDSLHFDKTLMETDMHKSTEIQIIIHYPGQLIRSLDTPNFKSTFGKFRYDKIIRFQLAQSTVVRRRPDSSKPCNSTIQNYDMHLISTIIDEIKCIPPYWNEYAKQMVGLDDCKSPTTLQTAYTYTRNWKDVMQKHSRPCIDMYNIVGWNLLDVEETEQNEELLVKFMYQEHYYQELEYLPDFDLETFISNIGGFVGIFLGYSLMQFPELLGTF